MDENKIYVDGGEALIHNPTPVILPFLRAIDPSFKVASVPPEEGFVPQFQKCKAVSMGISEQETLKMSLPELQGMHSKARSAQSTHAKTDSISLLDLKKIIAFREMTECEICAWRCKANRFTQKGRCGLDFRAYHAPPFLHLAEEELINPAIVVNWGGCSWDCVYCISAEFKIADQLPPLDVRAFWNQVNSLLDQNWPVNTLEFAGGNPTESVAWILELLAAARDDFNLPIVWNSNLYATAESIDLLNGVVDVYLPDFRYGNDQCAKRLSGIDNYWEYATKCLEAMISQNARVLSRILLLPNHVQCCHRSALEWLARFRDRGLWLSVMDQFVPEHKANLYQDINRRPNEAEIKEVEDLVHSYGLRDIGSDCTGFWDGCHEKSDIRK